MSIDFFEASCQTTSGNKIFGLCDDAPPAKKPAYIDEIEGGKWIAVVHNDDNYTATFTAIDNCIPISRVDGKMAKRCDGHLSYEDTIIFVELKQRDVVGTQWIIDGEEQLKTTISYFEGSELSEGFTTKKAYIANNHRPRFRDSQIRRMEQFKKDTGYVLRIENRIWLE